MMRPLLPVLIVFLAIRPAHAQSFVPLRADGNGIAALRAPVSLEVRAMPLGDALSEVARQAALRLTLASDLEALRRPVSARFQRVPAAQALLTLAERGGGIELRVSETGDVVVVPLRDHTVRPITGIVQDASDGSPIPDAEIAIDGAPSTVRSARDGSFRIESPTPVAGALHIQRFGYRPDSVNASPGQHLVVRLVPAPAPLAAVIVTPGTYGVMEQTLTNRQTLSREDIETAPQLGEDAFRAIMRLPGVSASDISAAFSIRGAAPREVLVNLDGLELYEPFHLKDLDNAISILDVASIGGLDLNTGGFGTEHGDRLGGVLDIRSRSALRAQQELALSITALRALSSGTFADGKGSWLASARRGYLDLALAIANGDDNLSPRYGDVFGRVSWALGSQLLGAHVLHAWDRLSYEDTPSQPHLDSRYGSSYAWVRLSGPLGTVFEHDLVLSLGSLDWTRDGRRGSGPDAFEISVDDRRTLDFAGLRQTVSWAQSADALLKAGFEVRRLSSDHRYAGWRAEPRFVDGAVEVAADTIEAALSLSRTRFGAWLSERVRLLPALALEAGLRWDQLQRAGAGRLQPRAHVAWTPDGRTTVRAGAGLYAQTHGLHEISTRDGENEVRPMERALHFTAGLEHRIADAYSARVEAYLRRDADPSPYWTNIDNTSDVFPELTFSRRRVDPEEARARGVEVALSKSGTAWAWSATYALAASEQRIDGMWVPRSRDQRHTVGFDLAWAPDARWRLAAAWQYHTGWPYTDVDLELNQDAWAQGIVFLEPVIGAYNAARFPSYHRLDLRVTRHFPTRRGRVSVFLDLFNAYDRLNVAAYHPSVRIDRTGITNRSNSSDSQLPRLPSLGIVWQF